MNKEALEFLKTQRTGVLAVAMLDGVPHGATLHFAHMDEPLTFIFKTTQTYKKVEALQDGEAKASFVVGTTEDVMKTLQMDGVARLADTAELREAYFEKFPEKKFKDTEDIFFIFIPTWWRFTDWTTPQGKMIWSSE
jgi:general stress protein 26